MQAPAQTLVELLRRQATERPDQVIYTFFADGEGHQRTCSYGELDRQARAIGAALQAQDAAGKRVLLLYPPGLDYIHAFFGCLYAGAITIPAYPPRPNRRLDTIQHIIADSGASLALTTSAHLLNRGSLRGKPPQEAPFHEQTPPINQLCKLNWLVTDRLADRGETAWRQPDIDAGSLAFIQYTSGSTAAPKGVMVSHANLLHNLALIQQRTEQTPQSHGVIWLPPYHDLGLIGGILLPLYAGCSVSLLAPNSFIRSPLRWLQLITDTRATTSGAPNFAYDLCARTIADEHKDRLDLSCWRVAFNGAEPIRPETLRQFAAAFAGSGFRSEAFYPCYGLAEATLFVSGGAVAQPPQVTSFDASALTQGRVVLADADRPDTRLLVSSGEPAPGQPIAIVDPASRCRCPGGQVGEIWVAGPSVAQGYWNQPALSAATFRACTADTAEGPFLRTGDLGFLHEGRLFVAGRIKDLIVIRGRNHYPQDIELTAEQSHPALRRGGCAAFSIDVEGEERLVVAQELERHHLHDDPGPIISAIRRRVAAAHGLHVYTVALVRTGRLPKTSSGKIQRQACKAAFLSGSLELLNQTILDQSASKPSQPAPADELPLSRAALLALGGAEREQAIERAMVAIIARQLGVSADQIDLQSSMVELGLDSLAAVAVHHRLETALGVVLPIGQLLECTSLVEAARLLSEELQAHVPAIAPPRAQEGPLRFPLSAGQRALWFLSRLAPQSTAYTIASAVRLIGALDQAALRAALAALLERHAALRTVFQLEAGIPVQCIRPTCELPLSVWEASAWGEEQISRFLAEAAAQPFDLEQGPLIRLHLLQRSAQKHMLFLAVHHLVSDLWSMAVLLQEFALLYSAFSSGHLSPLAPPTAGYSDYVAWQEALLRSQRGEQLWSYWRRQLAAPLPLLDLPADRARPPVQSYRGAAYPLRIGADLTDRLKALAEAEGVTLYTLLLAAFQVLLARYSGQDDILIGSPAAGRSRADFGGLIGYFVNVVPLRANCQGRQPFRTFLQQVRRTVLDALAHQDYPFPLLVERLQPQRDPSRPSLISVLCTFQQAHLDPAMTAVALGVPGAHLDLAGLTLETVAVEQHTAQFDLTLVIGETGAWLSGMFQYNTDLFDQATIARMAQHLEVLFESIAAAPHSEIGALSIWSPSAHKELRAGWNTNRREEPLLHPVHQLFEAQAERSAAAVAVRIGGREVSYAELNRRANQLARYLRRSGVGPCVPVGICLERSIALVVSLLAVLKAGGVVVPLDPGYAAGRLAFILEDSRARVLITTTTDDRRPATENKEQRTKNNQQKPGTENRASPCHLVTDIHPLTRSPAHPFTTVVGGPWLVVDPDRDQPVIAREPAGNLGLRPTLAHPAYIVYTSGSTGLPKGVVVSGRSLANLCRWYQHHCPVTERSRVLLALSFCFDAALKNILTPLLVGGTLVLADPGPYDPSRLLRTIAEERISIINATPSMIEPIVERAAAEEYQALHSLEYLGLGGETLALARLRPWLTSTHSRCEVFNIYGPTECADISTAYHVQRGEHATLDRVPVGRPIDNMQAYVLDDRGNLQPPGVMGELYIAGAGLAEGYLNRPDLTAERFVPNPFATTTDDRRPTTDDREPGTENREPTTDNQRPTTVSRPAWLENRGLKTEDHSVDISEMRSSILYPPSSDRISGRWSVVGGRLYRTGDLARYRPDGTIEFLARGDRQLKIRGMRIEPGEIEAALYRHPAVHECVVLARGNGAGAQRLVAYLSLEPRTKNQEPALEDGGLKIEDSSADASRTLSSILYPPSSIHGELRAFLKQRLPDYMVPSAFVILDALPLTPHGKLDHWALPVPDERSSAPGAAPATPRNELERALLAIWQAVLNTSQVGIDDNFFDLGGHSLLLAQVQSKLQERERQQVEMLDLLTYPTIRELAAHLSRRANQARQTENGGLGERMRAGQDRLKQQRQRRRSAMSGGESDHG